MDDRRKRARMPIASGRFFVRRLGCSRVGLAALALLTGCVSVARAPTSEPESVAAVEPPITLGILSPGQEALAAQLIGRAREALTKGDLETARMAAREVVSTYPQAAGSSGALWVLAQASLGLGEPEEAAAAGERYRRLLALGDARLSAVRLLLGNASLELGRARDAVEHYLSIDRSATLDVREEAMVGVESAANELDESELDFVISGVTGDDPLLAPLLARSAVDRFLRADEDEARRLARRALSLGATGLSRQRAEAVLSGDLSAVVVTPTLGAILPTTGSPRSREFAAYIQEGIRVALRLHGGPSGNRAAVELSVLDDRGDPTAGPRLLRQLEASGVMGVVGPLEALSLVEVARRRATDLVLISPTAPTLPDSSDHVYSLSGAEPGGARTLAEYAAGTGLTTAALVYPRSRDASFEAVAFREAFEARGGTVLGEFTYPPGTTFFEEQLRGVEALLPAVLVLPLPLRDVELLAPQVTFFGLDSLEVRVLGTAAWTRPETLERVDARHLNGVIAASPRPPGGEIAGLERFVEAYEDLYQHSLRSPTPALGYDAASLLLAAMESGARTPAQVAEALEQIEAFPGATGTLSVSQGRIVREHHLVCIQDGTLRNVPEGMISFPIRVDPLPDPETDSIPEGPGRIVGFQCPEYGMVIDSVPSGGSHDGGRP